MANDGSSLAEIETATLEPLVRDLLGEPAAVVEEWSCRPLGGGGGEGLGLYQVAGSARVDSGSHPWALVVKICAAADGADPGAWAYPAREGLAYSSGLLGDLPGGIAAPRCLAVETQPDGTSWLWLEAVIDDHPGPWSLERYALVARHLGRFNGAYLTGVPLPEQPWLSQGWLRSWVESASPSMTEFEHLAGSDRAPLVWQVYPPPVFAELRRLWAERERFLTALDRLPQTFCHHDAFRRNLLHRVGPEGEDLVAVDWAYAGRGAVGEELVPLVLGSFFFFEAVGIRPHDLDAACFAGYVAGLREVGWMGDERLVRLGFTAAAALRYTVGAVQLELPLILDPSLGPAVENVLGHSLEEARQVWEEVWSFQLQLAEEARRLRPLVG
jgi:hypothetical protein